MSELKKRKGERGDPAALDVRDREEIRFGCDRLEQYFWYWYAENLNDVRVVAYFASGCTDIDEGLELALLFVRIFPELLTVKLHGFGKSNAAKKHD